VKLPAEVLAQIDVVLDPVIERNHAKKSDSSPKTREA
jgi:hypothetical protein